MTKDTPTPCKYCGSPKTNHICTGNSQSSRKPYLGGDASELQKAGINNDNIYKPITDPIHQYAGNKLEDILDNHAEYYIKQTMKFFQENGESPALSKNNEGDLEARAQINQYILAEILELIGEDEPESENIHSDRFVGASWSNALRKELRAKAQERFGNDR